MIGDYLLPVIAFFRYGFFAKYSQTYHFLSDKYRFYSSNGLQEVICSLTAL